MYFSHLKRRVTWFLQSVICRVTVGFCIFSGYIRCFVRKLAMFSSTEVKYRWNLRTGSVAVQFPRTLPRFEVIHKLQFDLFQIVVW